MNTTKPKDIGTTAENMACTLLQRQGLLILARNYTCYHGEIDLIMQDEQDIVFVEVRLRGQSAYGTAFESVDRNKQRRIVRAAKHYLQSKGWLYKMNSRFDIVAIERKGGHLHLDWLRNAFTVDNDL